MTSLRDIDTALLVGRPITAGERAALRALIAPLLANTYTLKQIGSDAAGVPIWQACAPGRPKVYFASAAPGVRYIVELIALGAAGESVAVLDPDSKNPRQAVEGAVKRAIDSVIEPHCPLLADVLRGTLTVRQGAARLLTTPGVRIEVGNAPATQIDACA